MFGFPLLLIPLAVCNIILFLMRDVGFDAQLFALSLPSGAMWKVALGDAFVTLGLLLLLLEVQKSARPGGKYVTDHLLALLIFAGAAVEFVMLPQFANTTFFLLTLIALVDFLSGLALRGRRPKRVREIEDTAVVAAAPAAQPVVLREPVREPLIARDPAPAVVQNPAPAPTPLPTVETTPAAAHVEEAKPPRVEPIIDMDPILDPMPDEPRTPPRPAPQP